MPLPEPLSSLLTRISAPVAGATRALAAATVLTAVPWLAATSAPGMAPAGPTLENDRLLVTGQEVRHAGTGRPWVIRCVAAATVAPGCRHRSLSSALAASGTGDLLLIGAGADLDLKGARLTLPQGVQLLAARSAPEIATSGGPVRLADLLPTTVSTVRNGVLALSGGARVVGLRFEGVSLHHQAGTSGLQGVEIQGNHFEGSYTDNPGGLSPLALPTLWLQGGQGHRLQGNRILRPEVRSLVSALGRSDRSATELVSVCGSSGLKRSQRPAGERGTCLSGNAIRLDQTGTTRVTENWISEALDEAIRLENPRGPIAVVGNRIEAMRQGPDSNMQAAIFTRVTTDKAQVSIRHNKIGANATGILEPADGPSALRGGLVQRLGVRNLIDPIEIGLCRGDRTFPRADDKYGDPSYGSGDCQPSGSLDLEVVGNHVQPGRLSDADGIDYNVGMGGSLRARTETNRVDTIGEGNSAYTVDLRGDGRIDESVRANRFVADTGISIEVGNLNGDPINQGRMQAVIADNTILADSRNSPRLTNGKAQDNEATGVEIEVQGSSTATSGFDLAVRLIRNRITVFNQSDNPKSDGFGISLGSKLFKGKDGQILQNGSLLSGRLAATLIGNRVEVTPAAGSGPALALAEDFQQGQFQRQLLIEAGNTLQLRGSSDSPLRVAPPAGRRNGR